MGARLYNPTTGRFTSIDPAYGGNETAYNYPNDPINAYDLDGERSWWRRARSRATSWWMRQRHVVGDLHMRKGRPAIHWNSGGRRSRVEWDKNHRWHYNSGAKGHHGSVREGARAYGRHWGSRLSRWGRSAARWGGRIGRAGLWVPVPSPCSGRYGDWMCRRPTTPV